MELHIISLSMVEGKGTYCFVERPQEVDLIGQGIYLGLQLHLVHVGSVDILKNNQRHQVWLLWRSGVLIVSENQGVYSGSQIRIRVLPTSRASLY